MAEQEVAAPSGELDLQYIQYEPQKEEQYLPAIRQLISKDLSEPYSIYVYRYFLYQWGDLCYMVPSLFLSSPNIHSMSSTSVTYSPILLTLSRHSPQTPP